MPIKYTVSDDGMFVYAIVEGVLTMEDVHNYGQEISDDNRIKAGFNELFDLSLMTKSALDQQDLHRIVELTKANKKMLPTGRLAIVAGRDESFSNSRYYEKIVSPLRNVIVFNNVSTARKWLGVD